MRRNVQKPPWLEEGAYLLRVKRSSRGMECMGASFSKKATTDVLCIPQLLPSFASGPEQINPFVSDLAYICPPIMKGEVPFYSKEQICASPVSAFQPL